MQRLKLNSAGACAFALAMLMTACSDSGSPSESTYQADVRRTSFGYPHIKANNEKGLGYGVGYAFAQDNFCLLAEDVATVEGARSKYFGVTSTYDPDGSGTSVANLPSDFFYKIMNEAPLVDATWQRQSEEVKDLVRGYAAGVNRYLRDTGSANLPAACKGAAWVRPINELDLMRMMRRFALAGSGTQFVEAFYAAQPPATATTNSAERARPAQIQSVSGYTPAAPGYWRRLLRTDHASRGSNGVALGREATESGAGLLLGNPHFPWTSPYRFYQLHLTIPGKVDVLGASLGGFPVVNIGHNGNVAWTHTNNTSAHFTLFHLTLDPANVARYLIDGQSKALNAREFTVDSGAGGLLRRTYYFSEHGPLLAIPGLLDWTRSAAFAFGDANLDNDRLFAQWGL